MRIIITGSRGWNDRKRIEDRLFFVPGDSTIVHGHARGVDRMAEQEALKAGLLIEAHPAQWNQHGDMNDVLPCSCRPESSHCRLAGFRRNELMASLGADLCLAFWDGKSHGTMDMMERAARYGIPIEVQHKYFPNRPQLWNEEEELQRLGLVRPVE